MDHQEGVESKSSSAPGHKTASSTDQVLGMLAKLEQQLEQLGSVQRQHDERLASLAQKEGAGKEAPPAKPAPPQEASATPAAPKEPAPKKKGGGGAWWEQHTGVSSSAAPKPEPEPEPEPEAQAAPPAADAPPAVSGEELEAVHDQITALRSHLEQAKAQKEAELADSKLQHQLDQAEGLVGDLTEQYEQSQRELAASAEELEASKQETEALRGRIAELETQVASSGEGAPDQEALVQENQRLAEAVQERDQQLIQLKQAMVAGDEENAAHRVAAQHGIIQQQRQQIERLTEQLQAMAATGHPEEVEQRDERIAELEEEIEDLKAEVKAGVGKKVVGGLVGAMSKGSKKGGAEDFTRRLQALTAECNSWRAEAERLREQLESGEAAQPAADGAETEHLEERIRELEAELNEARMAVKSDQAELHVKHAGELRQQREEIAEAQQRLGAAEERLVRKWARPRAVTLLGWVVVIAAATAAGSWFAASAVVPPLVVVSVELEAEPPFGKPLTQEQAASWREWHLSTLASEGFLKTISRRLSDRRLDAYRQVKALTERLSNDMTVDATENGRLVLSLAGRNPDESKALMDAIATTLAVESEQAVSRRVDNAPAVVQGVYKERGQTRYARVNPDPIEDNRLLYALIFFTGGFIAAVIMASRIYKWLLKAKNAVQEHQHFLESDGYDLDEVF